MRGVLLWFVSILLSVISVITKSHAQEPMFSFAFDQPVTICEFQSAQLSIPQFSEPECQSRTLKDLNPQKRELWVRLTFDTSKNLQLISPPYGLYLFGKTSSRVYLNNQLLGSNGVPASDSSEEAGVMDIVFHIPSELILKTNNELVMHLSAHHSIVELGYPIHMVGIGQFADPKRQIQKSASVGLILIGAFSVGFIYFLRLSFGKTDDTRYRVFAALCLIAGIQLATELSRGLIDYAYPVHDIRLLLVTALSFLFGILLLTYSSIEVARTHALHWVYSGIILTLLVIIFVEGFDTKTTAGVFIPLLFSLVQLLWYWKKNKNNALLRWFGVQFIIAITICLSVGSFHEITYFLIVGLLLCYLFIQHAKQYKHQLEQRQNDQTRIAKLEYKLAQNTQSKHPAKIQISTGNKNEYISTSDIAYCKAAGDYVELHLFDLSEKLYSGSLKQLEEKLPSIFIRVHRSYLVNLNEVTSLAESQGSSNQLSLTNEQKVPVSRRLLPFVRKSLKTSI